MPFKMMGKSPLMKTLVGKQGNLPPALKDKIKAAPGKMMYKKASPAKDLKSKYDSEGNLITAPNQQSNIDSRKANEAEKTKQFNLRQKENDEFNADLDYLKNDTDTGEDKGQKTRTKTEEIAKVEKKSTGIGIGKPLVFGKKNRFNSDAIDKGKDMAKGLDVEKSMGETVKDKVTDKVQVGSGSTKRLPIDAMQDRLTKNIDRRTRKSDVRKQTRTAKQASRQEGSTRREARDKVGKLGINPNTGKSFDNAKQKQDFINAKGKDTFVSDLQKKIGNTMKKSGVNTSTLNKKETGSASKAPKLNAFGSEGVLGGQSFGITKSKQKSKKKVLSTKVVKKEPKPLETKSFNVDKALKSKGKDIKKSNKVLQKESSKSEKERVKEGKKEIKGVRK